MNKSNWRGKRQTGQKPRSAEKEGAGGRGGGTTRISPDSQAGRGNRNCEQNENMAGIGWVENVRGRGRRELGWEETVVQLEGVLGEEEVWRRKFEQREGKRHLSNEKLERTARWRSAEWMGKESKGTKLR